MRQARLRGSALPIGAQGLLLATLMVSTTAQVPLGTAPRRDILLALPSATQQNEFEIRHWTSSGAANGFVARQAVVGAAGTLTHLDRNDAVGGDFFASADLVPAGQAGSVIYGFVSPFTRTVRMNHLPLRTHFAVAAPDLITDFEYDPPNPSDPTRSDSLVVVGRDTVSGNNWLQRVPLSGPPGARILFGAGAQELSLAIEPIRGDIHVVDERGLLFSFSAGLALTSFNLITPVIACHDLAWHAGPGRVATLLAPGHAAAVATDGLFAVRPGVAPTATPEAILPGACTAMALDAAEDGYCLVDAGGGRREVWLWESKTSRLVRTNIPPAPYQAFAWASRCTVEMLAAAPGTPIRAELAPPRVGDGGLGFTVTPPPGVNVAPVGMLFSSRWTDQPYGFGRNARLFVDPSAPGFSFVPLPGAQPPTVFVPHRIVEGYDGARVVAQMVWEDVATKEWLTSWAANFVIGQ